MKIDFIATKPHYIDHLLPTWEALPLERRGTFYKAGEIPSGLNPIVAASYGDFMIAARESTHDFKHAATRKFILTEHGTGLTPGDTAGYATGAGRRNLIDLFLMPNEYSAKKLKLQPHQRAEVVGTPKLDKYKGLYYSFDNPPIIAIACHWGDEHSQPPEAGSVWYQYFATRDRLGQNPDHAAPLLYELAKRYHIIGHSHPLAANKRRQAFAEAGIEYVETFDEVISNADIYINECSSTAYEWVTVTGKPVILLNAPQFRREVNSGLRFWDYADIGEQVNKPSELIPAIAAALENPRAHEIQCRLAANDLYPYYGRAAERNAEVLISYLDEFAASKAVAIETSKSRGVVYVAFGDKARVECVKSIDSLRRAGCTSPVATVGDAPVKGAQFIEWTGESPFDPTRPRNFQFLAGRVKPHLCGISELFDETLYIDCDTEIQRDVTLGFGFLRHFDVAVTEERLSVGELYNAPMGGWQHNIIERDEVITAYGGDGNFPFINSGVFFWRRNEATRELFALWSQEWMKRQSWDEQKALMRALLISKVRPLVLSELWNFPHGLDDKDMKEREKAKKAVIIHLYGRGFAARVNVSEIPIKRAVVNAV